MQKTEVVKIFATASKSDHTDSHKKVSLTVGHSQGAQVEKTHDQVTIHTQHYEVPKMHSKNLNDYFYIHCCRTMKPWS